MLDVHLQNETCSNGSVLRVWCGARSSVCVVTDQSLFIPSVFPVDNSTKPVEGKSDTYNLLLGLSLALLSAVLIGVSVIMKKKALLRLQSDGGTRAGDGGHGYLKDWLWWGGLLTMGAGEVCNFVAYAFAPATLVTPLGALAVIISAVLASYLLGEVLNVIGKFGCFLCILGSVLLACFLVYIVLVLLSAAVLVLIVGPRFGQTHILVYLSICSLLGAFTVSSAKGLAIVLQTSIYDYLVFANPLSWILLVTLVLSILAQVNYLNKSLDIFNTQMVYPIYYVLFTSVVLCTSVILFQEWSSMSPIDVVTTVGSFMVIVVGVTLLNLFRDNTLKQLSDRMSRPTDSPPDESRPASPQGAPTDEPARHPVTAVTSRDRGKKEDKRGLMENMVIESLPPMRDEGPRVFIIS